MAHHLQKVAILLLLGVAVSSAAPKRKPFSHKYHLTQVASCENCHTAATESTSGSDNLIPDKSACATCHDEIEIGAPRQIGVQKFNHKKHVAMGNVAPVVSAAIKSKSYLSPNPPSADALAAVKDPCSGCHTGIAESEDVPHDKVQKSHFPQMATCLVCHTRIDPPDSCAKCHAELTPKFRPASHAADFGDKHSDKGLDKSSCATCHGRKFTCKGCH